LKDTKLYRERYTLGELIATGGYASIFEAREEDRREQVAIKVCNKYDDDSYSRSLVREAELIRRFKHNNIVKLHPILREDRASVFHAKAVELPHTPDFFVMEYLRGGTLEQYLQQVETVTPPEAATIALEIARALDHIHLKGFAHNDLKLENIVFREPVQAERPFTPVLVDFGIATRVLPPPGVTLYIMSPEQVGLNSQYAAPEQGVSDSMKIDVWGMGVLLYRMMGGRLPFNGRNEKSLTDLIRKSRPISLRSLSPLVTAGLDEIIIDGCLAKNPSDRLSLLALAHELKRIGGDGVPAHKSGPVAKPSRANWLFRWKK
jgi:serine/threonine protein kinase